MSNTFVVPTTKITSTDDLDSFLSSTACAEFVAFLEALNGSVANKKISDPCEESETIQKILQVVKRLSDWIDEIPPLKQPMRYGNKAYRDWFDRLTDNSLTLMQEILTTELQDAAVELSVYFREAWGNKTRIDYGTGHETCFVAWLFCLFKIGLIGTNDFQAVVLRVFTTYLKIMRKIQLTYGLEPAGSHGVWSLDDYQFLAFYWGSSQLLDHKHIKPRSIRNMEVLEAFAHEYMYLDAIQFIHKVKTGPFGEHSPILSEISNVPVWSKVNTGLMKMYKVEVIGKFPIMQHFLFGSLISFDPPTNSPSQPQS